MKAVLVVVALVVIVTAPAALAGGPFERIVAVGADGGSRTIELAPSGTHSESALSGTAAAVPSGGYVRLYTFVGSLPAEPGRFYPGAHVACITWKSEPSDCVRLGNTGVRLLAPIGRLSLRHDGLTVPVSVEFGGHLLPYANANVFLAFELAFERPAVAAGKQRDAVPLVVEWRGPEAAGRPTAVLLTPAGVVANGRLRPLGRGIWCYVVGNIPDQLKTASLDEGVARERC